MKKQKVKNILQKISNLLLNILIVLITGLTLIGFYYFYQIAIEKKGCADLFGYTLFEVATGSMADNIQIGDVVIVKITNQVEENDIIVYEENQNFITHRLIKKDENGLVAKGDANNSEDKPISEEQVLGKVIQIIPKLGIWRKIILSPEILIGIIIVVILIGVILHYNTKTEEENETQVKK